VEGGVKCNKHYKGGASYRSLGTFGLLISYLLQAVYNVFVP
jgi:hypothetical protein